MEVTLLNTNLEAISVIDVFESLIWTDRYYGAGDFEMVKSPDYQFAQALSMSQYMELKDSEHLMIIDHLNIHTDEEAGNKAIIKGMSIETVLNQRIVWAPTVLTGDFQDGILKLLNENAINPTDTDRKINLLEFEASTDPAITDLTVESQFFGDILYKVIWDLCASRGVGFKITLTNLGKFKFKLYSGVDRSYDQFSNPFIVFSPEFENLINSDYIVTNRLLKTVSLVAGEEGVGNIRRTVAVSAPGGAGTDLNRREMFTDASGITRNTPGGRLTEEEYLLQLEQKGMEDLANNTFIQTFEGQADVIHTYIYGQDFFMGDILQVENEYGHEATCRVIELIRSQDPSGYKVYPTFGTV